MVKTMLSRLVDTFREEQSILGFDKIRPQPNLNNWNNLLDKPDSLSTNSLQAVALRKPRRLANDLGEIVKMAAKTGI